jgi:hypothetical protein
MASFLSNVASAAGALANGINTVRTVGNALRNLSDPSKLLSAIRTRNLPLGGEGLVSIGTAKAQFQSETYEDWRAKLILLDQSFFNDSPVLKPIQDNGLIFPYTPIINIGHQAIYNTQNMVHQNYGFLGYQHSQVSEIQVVGDFPVEDATQAAYWIAVVHFLRSVTKMYTGNEGDAYPGNPPPILNFSAYGDFVFKNVPVVVSGFTINLPKDVDYIGVNVGYESEDGQGSASSQTNTGGGGGMMGENHVPTNSSITVSLKPIYSREQIRKFSLNTFVQGGYVGKGYV